MRGALLLSLLIASPAGAAVDVWAERATIKLRPSVAARQAPSIQLAGARNEFLSFQVAVRGEAAQVSASTAGFTGPDGQVIGGRDVTLYRVATITTTRPTGGSGDLGEWPDGLIPETDEIAFERRGAFPFATRAGETRAIWVDVLVPEGAVPGTYRGAVRVTADGVDHDVQVEISVVGATLPSTPSLASAFLLWPPHVCNAHTGKADCGGAGRKLELLQQYHRLALDHRISLASAFVLFPDGEDWSAFDAAYAPFFEGTATTRLRGARLTSAQYMGPQLPDAYRRAVQHFRERGWLPIAYDYTGDEPPYGISFEAVRERLTLLEGAAPELTAMLTTSLQVARAEGLEARLDRLVVLINHMDGVEAPYTGDQRAAYDAFLARPGRSLWIYQSCMSHGCAYGTNDPVTRPGAGWPTYAIDRSAAKNRAFQWLAFLERAGGELYYQTVGMLTSAWKDQFRFNGNGDGTLVYPGLPSVIGGRTAVPLPSIRLKMIRAGYQDYEWLRMVSDAGDPDFAYRVARELIPSAHEVPDDGARFDEARLKLIARYLELKGQPPLPPEGEGAPGPGPGPGQPPEQQPSPGAQSSGVEAGSSEAGCGGTAGGAALWSPLALLAAGALLLRRRARRRLDDGSR